MYERHYEMVKTIVYEDKFEHIERPKVNWDEAQDIIHNRDFVVSGGEFTDWLYLDEKDLT